MGMYQNQSCYIWEDEHPFASYLGFTRVPRFWLPIWIEGNVDRPLCFSPSIPLDHFWESWTSRNPTGCNQNIRHVVTKKPQRLDFLEEIPKKNTNICITLIIINYWWCRNCFCLIPSSQSVINMFPQHQLKGNGEKPSVSCLQSDCARLWDLRPNPSDVCLQNGEKTHQQNSGSYCGWLRDPAPAWSFSNL